VPWREIRWTEENEEHISHHKVMPHEVEEVVNTQPRWVEHGRDETELIYGTTNVGRYLLVVLTESLDGLDYVVTAREMDQDEKQRFRRLAH
jgi:uncharacterized DUF497 family protein